MSVFVTGAAGFIGFHLSPRLLERGMAVVGFENFNPYFDPALKRARRQRLQDTASRTGSTFTLIEADLEDGEAVRLAFAEHRPERVVNLAAQAGVRYSIENPAAYIQANLVGFGHVLEGCRHHGIQHLAVCQQHLGVWGQYTPAVQRAPRGGSPGEPLRGQQKGQ